jgi:hypothetical protein
MPALLAASRDLKFTGSPGPRRDKQLGYFETNAQQMAMHTSAH